MQCYDKRSTLSTMTHKEIQYVTQILQNHTNKVFLYDTSQGYSIKVPEGPVSSQRRSGLKYISYGPFYRIGPKPELETS